MECCVTLKNCDKLSGSAAAAAAAGGSIVGGGKRTKVQQSPVSQRRGKPQSASTIDKQKFYSADRLTRPPIASRTRRRIPPRINQLRKLTNVGLMNLTNLECCVNILM